MAKEEILKDIQSLIEDIDKCTETIVYNRVKGNQIGLRLAHSDMEGLMAKAHQELSFLYDYIKEGGKYEQ